MIVPHIIAGGKEAAHIISVIHKYVIDTAHKAI